MATSIGRSHCSGPTLSHCGITNKTCNRCNWHHVRSDREGILAYIDKLNTQIVLQIGLNCSMILMFNQHGATLWVEKSANCTDLQCMSKVEGRHINKFNCSNRVQRHSSFQLSHSLERNTQLSIHSIKKSTQCHYSTTWSFNGFGIIMGRFESKCIICHKGTHIQGSSIVWQSLICEDEDPMFVVGLGETRHSLRSFPEATYLDTGAELRAVGESHTTPAPRDAHI